MEPTNRPIRRNEVGAYCDLVARPNPDGLIILNEPPLDYKLAAIAFRLRRALTRDEIVAEQAKAPAIALTKQAAEEMLAARARQGQS